MDTSREPSTTLASEKPKRRGKSKAELDAIRPRSRPVKHGIYTKIALRRMDKRTRLWKHAMEVKRDIIASLGGDEEILSCQEKIVIDDLIVPQLLAVRSFVQRAMSPDFEAGQDAIKYWISLSNSLRLNLCAIGLSRRAKDITPLSERLAALAARSAKKEGNNGQG